MKYNDSDRKFGLFSLTRGDRLGGTLCELSIRNPVLAVMIACLAALMVPIVAAMEGNLVNTGLTLDLLHDLGWWNQFLLGFPVLIYIAGAYFGAFPKTLQQLTEAGVIQATQTEWQEVRQYANRRLINWLYTTLPYVCGIFAAALSFPLLLTPGTWYLVSENIAGWFVPVQVFLLYYFMIYLALRLGFVFLILQKLFTFNVNIQPFHEDDCGGLRSLAELSANLNAGVFVFGIIASIGIYANTSLYGVSPLGFSNLAMLIAYIVLASVAFFLPLYATSQIMREAKLKVADTIRERYLNLKDTAELDVPDTQPKAQEIDGNLQALKSLRNKVRSMQVWPFNLAALIKFSLSITTPFIVLVYLQVVAG